MNKPSYLIVHETYWHVVLRDCGPWDQHMTITNAAEAVVEEMAPYLNGRKLFYYDSEGSLDELVIKDNKFHDFRPGGPMENQPLTGEPNE